MTARDKEKSGGRFSADILPRIVCVLLALVIWLYVVFNNTPDFEKTLRRYRLLRKTYRFSMQASLRFTAKSELPLRLLYTEAEEISPVIRKMILRRQLTL